MLIGTKSDLESERKISQYEINQFVEKMKIELNRSCSAFDGDNVSEIFNEFAAIVYERVKREEEEKDDLCKI